MTADRAIARARLATPLAELAAGAEAAAESYEQLARDLAAIADDLPAGAPERRDAAIRIEVAEAHVRHHREVAATYRRREARR